MEIFSRRKRFLPKYRGIEKDDEIFFQNLEMKFIFQIIFSKKKFFQKIFFQEIFSRFLEKAKNFIISFFIPLNFNGVFGERIWQASSFSHPKGLSGKKV